jgi:hypothetical protein
LRGRIIMARRFLAFAALAALTACSQDGPGRAAIVDRCVAGGETPEICKCLADSSSQKLDDDMFELVILGAQGEQAKTDQRLKEMSPERQTRFTLSMREIVRGCGAQGYLAGS